MKIVQKAVLQLTAHLPWLAPQDHIVHLLQGIACSDAVSKLDAHPKSHGHPSSSVLLLYQSPTQDSTLHLLYRIHLTDSFSVVLTFNESWKF